MSDRQGLLRKQVSDLLDAVNAHPGFDQVLGDFPVKLRGVRVRRAPHTAWQLLEHMRICQWDILEFSRNPKHPSLKFPDDYWPKRDTPRPGEWKASMRAFRTDLEGMQRLIGKQRIDLFATVKHPDAIPEHTLLRNALLLADHNSYHLGQIVLLRRLLGTWKY